MRRVPMLHKTPCLNFSSPYFGIRSSFFGSLVLGIKTKSIKYQDHLKNKTTKTFIKDAVRISVCFQVEKYESFMKLQKSPAKGIFEQKVVTCEELFSEGVLSKTTLSIGKDNSKSSFLTDNRD
jgi:hypothetical protein